MGAETDPLEWCCRTCRRPVIDRDPYAREREVTPLATIGALMGGAAIPPVWRPIARRQWIRRLEARVRRELEAHRAFEARVDAIARDVPRASSEEVPRVR